MATANRGERAFDRRVDEPVSIYVAAVTIS
jgi:hypothetical protein